MELIMEAAAAYFLFHVITAAIRESFRAVVTLVIFPIKAAKIISEHRRRAGALELHAPSYFLTGEE